MKLSEKIENNVILLSKNLGNFDLLNPNSLSPWGDDTEELYALCSTIFTIKNAMKTLDDTLWWLSTEIPFKTNISISPVRTVNNTIRYILGNEEDPEWILIRDIIIEDIPDRESFYNRLINCTTYSDIVRTMLYFDISIVDIIETLSFAVLCKPNFIIPSNKYDIEIEAAITLSYLNFIKILPNLNIFENEN
jgi:hypothetical protein